MQEDEVVEVGGVANAKGCQYFVFLRDSYNIRNGVPDEQTAAGLVDLRIVDAVLGIFRRGRREATRNRNIEKFNPEKTTLSNR